MIGCTVSLRWEDYKKMRMQMGQPVVGSQGLFEKIWREHDEIVEYGALGHPTCPICGKYQVNRDALGERTDAAAVAKRAQLDEDYQVHTEEHLEERRYADAAWFRGETYPKSMTCLRIDAPTQHQFDLPRQKKNIERCGQDTGWKQALDVKNNWRTNRRSRHARNRGSCCPWGRSKSSLHCPHVGVDCDGGERGAFGSKVDADPR